MGRAREGGGGWESRGTGTMWVIVQVENVSTCVVQAADMNDFGVLLSSQISREDHSSYRPSRLDHFFFSKISLAWLFCASF